MHVTEILKANKTTISFEFFPPKTELGMKELFKSIAALAPFNPSYVSVTYGAGGTTREYTQQLLKKLRRETSLNIVAHLTCVNHSQEEIYQIVEGFQNDGIDNIMALRGDLPKNGPTTFPSDGGFQYAHELVLFIKKNFPAMCVGVAAFPAGHYGTPNRLKELEYLKQKVDAGADYICTQMFFDNHEFYEFVERARLVGINVPIIAGIMPITSLGNMKKMAELALGTAFPSKLMKAIMRASDDQGIENVGIHWATMQISDLINNQVAGIHLYTLNKSNASQRIYQALGINNSQISDLSRWSF